MRKFPLRHLPGCVTHQYGVTMATAPHPDQRTRSQPITMHGAIQGLHVLNHVSLRKAFVLSLIFNTCKMRRIPIKNAVRLTWTGWVAAHYKLENTMQLWTVLRLTKSWVQLDNLTVETINGRKIFILVNLWIRRRAVLWVFRAHMLLKRHNNDPAFRTACILRHCLELEIKRNSMYCASLLQTGGALGCVGFSQNGDRPLSLKRLQTSREWETNSPNPRTECDVYNKRDTEIQNVEEICWGREVRAGEEVS